MEEQIKLNWIIWYNRKLIAKIYALLNNWKIKILLFYQKQNLNNKNKF